MLPANSEFPEARCYITIPIANLLGAANLEVTALLFRRLGEINKEIEAAKSQQNVIVKLLEGSIVYKKLKTIDEET